MRISRAVRNAVAIVLYSGLSLICEARPVGTRITVVVLDAETARPVTNAYVFARDSRDPKDLKRFGATSRGEIIIEKDRVIPSWGGQVQADGYYSSKASAKLETSDLRRKRPKLWTPEITVWMRKIHSSQETIHSYTGRDPEIRDVPLGYDLVKQDWVQPYGKGESSDFVFTYCERLTDDPRKWHYITFPSPLDGIQQYIPDAKQNQSAFRFPYEAPLDGYTNSIGKYNTWGIKPPCSNFSKTNCYIFRVRSCTNKQGQITGMYGAVWGGLGNSVQYRINTNRFSRSLEFKERKRP